MDTTQIITETPIQPMAAPVPTETVEPVGTMQPMVQAMLEPQEAPKPYTFRRLSSPDIFPMFKIIGKIGVKEFTAAIDKDVLKELIASFTEGKGEESFAVNGATVILGIADVIISKIPSCENDIYQILSQTSGMSIDEIKALDAAIFLEMVIDFIKKDEFKDFSKVVSKLFN